MSRLNFMIDSQLLDAVQYCEQKFVYDFLLHLQRAEPNRKILIGSFLHDLFKYYNLALKDGANHEDAKVAARANFDKILSELAIDPIDAELVWNVFVENTDYWSYVPITVRAVETPEVKLLYEDDKLRIVYVSKIDVKVDGPNYENMPVDYKSEHSRSDPNPLGNQFIGYAWSTDSPRIMVNKVGFQKTLKPPDKFRIYPFYYTPEQKDEWVEDTVKESRRMIELVNGRPPVKNRTSCDKYGGCKYKAVCGVSPSNREHIIKELFVETEPWSPFREDKE